MGNRSGPLRALSEIVGILSGLDPPIIWRPETPPTPHARRLMATLGVIIEEPMPTVSAHDLLTTLDCTYRACANEAVPGQDRCRKHQRDQDILTGHTTYCPGGCGQRFVGTELRGRGWVTVHAKHCSKARAALGEPEGATENGARRTPPSPEYPSGSPSPETLVELGRSDPVSDPGGESDAAPESTMPSSPSVPLVPDQPDPQEAPMPAKLAEDQEGLLVLSADQMTAWKAEHGRWPLPIDTADYPDELPSRNLRDHLEGGWQTVWTFLDAGKVPQGRAATNYRKNGAAATTAPVAPEKPQEDRPSTPEGDRQDVANEIERELLGTFAVNIELPAPSEGSFAAAAARLEIAAAALEIRRRDYEAALAELRAHPFFEANRDDLIG